jgi:hypothetical protein
VAARTEALRTAFVAAAEVAGGGRRGARQAAAAAAAAFVQVVYKNHPGVEWQTVEEGMTVGEVITPDAPWTASEFSSTVAFHANRISQRSHEARHRRPPWGITIITHGRPPSADSDESVAATTIMVWTLHHAIHDAASLDMVLAEVQAAYLGYKTALRAQLTQGITVLGARVDEVADERFWAEVLAGFADPDAVAFPDVTGARPLVRGRFFFLPNWRTQGGWTREGRAFSLRCLADRWNR